MLTITIQRKNSIERFLGKSEKKLTKLVAKSLPEAIEANGGIRKRNKRDIGRKIGYAAKDFAALRTTQLTPKKLKKLEGLGGNDAREAVCKGNVIAKPVLEELKQNGVPPAMAYWAVQFWRVLSVRPADDCGNRMHYLSLVPRFFDCVVSKNTVKDVYNGSRQLIKKSQCNPKRVVGARLNAAINHCSTKTFTQAFKIENCDCPEDAWELVTKTLSTKAASEAKALLPERDASPLDRLIIKPAKNRSRKNDVSIETFGLTGFEMGNWVNSSEGKVLQRLAFDAFSDLVSILGSRFVSLAKEGNLALSIGAEAVVELAPHIIRN